MITYLNSYLSARVLLGDLLIVDAHFSKAGVSDINGIIFLKGAFLVLGNLVDFELTIRNIYEEHRTLSTGFTNYRKHYEFAKYLRNKMAVHVLPQLVEKAIEWKPELRCLAAHSEDDPRILYIANLSLLETAINTYVDDQGKHKFFESETDLVYPPDWQRFLNFLEVSVRAAISYLQEFCTILKTKLDPSDPKRLNLDFSIKAGRTEFRFLKK